MMMKLLLIKDKVKEFYGKYDVYIDPVIKFLLAFASLSMLKNSLGFMSQLNSMPVILVASLICSLLPVNAVVVFYMLFMLGHIFALSMEAFVVCFLLMCIMFFTYFIFKPGNSIILVLVPLLFGWKLPYLVPILLGLTCSMLSAIPAAFGVVLYYMILVVKNNVMALTETESSSMLIRFQLMADQIVTNKGMLVMILAFALTIVLVYVIRRLSVAHSWKIAIGIGGIVELAAILVGMTMLEVSSTGFSTASLVIGMLMSALIALVVEFFLFSVDYSRTEYVQFEDDEYYYYVKAVPKLTVTPPQREVKRFTVNQKGREQGLQETVDLGEDIRNIMREMAEEEK
ncbi:MAG: hypothetical protein IKT45_00215 [Lachnospiraceae bacterium]|nr:hypothetical protein [Lachnospiraceae bacterium]